MPKKLKQSYPYIEAEQGKIIKLMDRIRKASIPGKADIEWLRKNPEFTGKRDHLFINLLQQLGFIGDDGKPTELWERFKGDQYIKTLQDAVLSLYKDIFESLTDNPCKKDLVYLTQTFMSITQSSETVARRMARTFKTLCQISGMDQADITENHKTSSGQHHHQNSHSMTNADNTTLQSQQNERCIELHIDMQIHISPDLTDAQIEKIFESIAKHLMRK